MANLDLHVNAIKPHFVSWLLTPECKNRLYVRGGPKK